MADADFLARLTTLADEELDRTLAVPVGVSVSGVGHRARMNLVKTAVACYLNPRSRWHSYPAALSSVAGWLSALRDLQAPDGLFSSGDNLASPPDSSFTVNDMALVQRLVTSPETCDDAALDVVRTSLAEMLADVTEALVSGGIHTPNHRWEISSALAELDHLRPQPRLRARIEEWLAEGVDVSEDGLYSERSPGYASAVSNPCLVILAAHLDRPDLLEIVHRSLHAQAGLTDVDGGVESVHSRRQDQRTTRFSVAPFAIQYRRFALLSGCSDCARWAKRAEPYVRLDPAKPLVAMLLEPALSAPLPVESEGRQELVLHRYPSASLVRSVQGRSSATVYGGSDVPVMGRVGSGLACNPTFLRWRYGDVVLDSVRLSRNFFGLGPFRSQGLETTQLETTQLETTVGWVHRLHERVSAAYYQPLSADARRVDGSYALEHEGRFAAAMSFSARDRSEVCLETELVLTTDAESVRLDARFAGAETAYAFELAFRPGGVLDGVRALPAPDCYELVDGFGTYRMGGDVVTFGPGNGSGPDQPPVYDPGEAYTFLQGTDAAPGIRVYVTGRTPGEHTLLMHATH